MDIYIVGGIVMIFPLVEMMSGYYLFRKAKSVKWLGIGWLLLGILSCIVTIVLIIKKVSLDYLLASVTIQVLLFLMLIMSFQIKYVIQNRYR